MDVVDLFIQRDESLFEEINLRSILYRRDDDQSPNNARKQVG
jgi:hypothetical protein